MTTLTERMNGLPETRRRKVEARARVLIAQEMSLLDLRKSSEATLAPVALPCIGSMDSDDAAQKP